jgi:cation:H+ antiporter
MNLIDFIIFFSGFALILLGANFLVDGGSALGRRFRIPDIVIGLTIVSFGTSAPEMAISIMASAKGVTDLAVSNVIGSNIFNTFMIIGVAALFYPITVRKNTLTLEFPGSMIASFLLLVFAVFVTFTGEPRSLSFVDGIIFLALFLGFLFYTYKISKNHNDIIEMPKRAFKLRIALLLLFAGLILLFAGGRLVVDGSVKIAASFGISERIIGLTIVAAATSLPELVTSAVAALKRNSDIAIGNALGSNIFNIFLVLGISALVRPLPANEMGIDIWIAILSNLLIVVFVLVFSPKLRIISRWQGGTLVLLYLVYVLYTIGFTAAF